MKRVSSTHPINWQVFEEVPPFCQLKMVGEAFGNRFLDVRDALHIVEIELNFNFIAFTLNFIEFKIEVWY